MSNEIDHNYFFPTIYDIYILYGHLKADSQLRRVSCRAMAWLLWLQLVTMIV